MGNIPKGLNKCEKCGEYKGTVKASDLNWEGSNAPEPDKELTVSCLCDGILCPKCKKNKIHRPISNTYYEETNRIEHYPYFAGMAGCSECQANREKDSDKDADEMANALVSGLRKASIESSERGERYDKIYEIERTKWAHNMGSMLRDDIPEKYHDELDRCIEKSQKVARDACQTVELTEAYLKKNNKK